MLGIWILDVHNANSADLLVNIVSWDKINRKSSDNNMDDNIDNQGLNVDKANELGFHCKRRK